MTDLSHPHDHRRRLSDRRDESRRVIEMARDALEATKSLAEDAIASEQLAEQARLTAVEAAREYRRALLHYGQVMRHRIVNPLTAITAGVDTLLDLDLDDGTRHELLIAMREKAEELRTLLLQPETNDPLEHDLDPVPILTNDDGDLPQRAAAVEAHFRDLNEKLIDDAPGIGSSAVIRILCECSAIHCVLPIEIPLASYLAVRHAHEQHVVMPLHNLPEVEDVIEKHDQWWVVQKRLPDA